MRSRKYKPLPGLCQESCISVIGIMVELKRNQAFREEAYGG
jgi:hypothetical protein